jgi:hypothetical protein
MLGGQPRVWLSPHELAVHSQSPPAEDAGTKDGVTVPVTDNYELAEATAGEELFAG